MPRYHYEVEDACEGKITGTITCKDEGEAYDEASIAGAENNMRDIMDIIITLIPWGEPLEE